MRDWRPMYSGIRLYLILSGLHSSCFLHIHTGRNILKQAWPDHWLCYIVIKWIFQCIRGEFPYILLNDRYARLLHYVTVHPVYQCHRESRYTLCCLQTGHARVSAQSGNECKTFGAHCCKYNRKYYIEVRDIRSRSLTQHDCIRL